MSKNIAISLFSSAVRPKLWMRFYNSLSSNTVPFEVIFVGNKIPEFKLPENCHFIYSEVKPVQCLEIGSRYATGDLIMNFADDCVFSEHALDNLYKEFNELNDNKVILSCRYVLFGEDIAEKEGYYWFDEPKSPIMPLSGLMKKEMWKKLGGIDKRFIAQFWDLDIAMRMYEIGGRVILSKNVWAEEIFQWKRFCEKRPRIFEKSEIYRLSSYFYHKLLQGISFFKKNKKKPRLFVEYGRTIDRSLLDQFWVIKNENSKSLPANSIHCAIEGKGAISKIRLEPVQLFEDKHILTVSQGSKGRWR